MRYLIALLILLVSASAHAQYPWGYAPYPPGYQPYPPRYVPYPPGYPAPDRRDAYPGSPPSGGPYGGPVPGGAPASLARAMLAAHNAVRARVADPPLAWSDQLAAVARDWADHLIATGQFAHRPNNRYGENLYTISGAIASPAQVVAMWADEARQYNIRTNSCAGVCGHYTQIVWRSTRAVGCAVASDARRQVWVCDYNPAGNVVGYRPY